MLNHRQLRQQIHQGTNLVMLLATAFMFWKLLSVVTYSESPIVVVLSGSMEPAFQRGDILFLYNRDDFVNVGDVVVYKVKDKTIPIVHRVMNEHHVSYSDKQIESASAKQKQQKQAAKNKSKSKDEADIASIFNDPVEGLAKPLVHSPKGKQLILTKGDNNPVNDLSLYGRNQVYLNRDEDLLGTVKGYIPFAGYITILLTENEYVKYGLIGLMAITSLFSNDE